MVVANLHAKLHEVLQADLPANLPVRFAGSRKPSHIVSIGLPRLGYLCDPRGSRLKHYIMYMRPL
jgi:hypothetical protein